MVPKSLRTTELRGCLSLALYHMFLCEPAHSESGHILKSNPIATTVLKHFCCKDTSISNASLLHPWISLSSQTTCNSERTMIGPLFSNRSHSTWGFPIHIVSVTLGMVGLNWKQGLTLGMVGLNNGKGGFPSCCLPNEKCLFTPLAKHAGTLWSVYTQTQIVRCVQFLVLYGLYIPKCKLLEVIHS